MKASLEKTIEKIKQIMSECHNPLIFFDDDCDGTSSFLMIYRTIKDGRGFIVKATPHITSEYVKKVEQYGPDAVFILDIAEVDQEFVDSVSLPIVWVDHHEVSSVTGKNLVKFNPKMFDIKENQPTSYLCYELISEDKKKEFLWLATVGSVSDWYVPEYIDNFISLYPEYLDEKKEAGEMLYKTKLGRLYRIINFLLKGKSKDVNKTIAILTRIKHPDELVEQSTEQGRFLYKRFLKIEKEYLSLLERAQKEVSNEIILFKYQSDEMSFASDLSNELMYNHPDKLIIIAREKNGEMKISLRSFSIDLTKALNSSLVGLSGYGGGHPRACGASVKVEHFDTFVENLTEYAKNNSK